MELCIERNQIEYLYALKKMKDRVEQIKLKNAKELIWILEHPHLYTGGSSATQDELINKKNLPLDLFGCTIGNKRGGEI